VLGHWPAEQLKTNAHATPSDRREVRVGELDAAAVLVSNQRQAADPFSLERARERCGGF